MATMRLELEMDERGIGFIRANEALKDPNVS
jgi:hypothetical protein